MGWEDDSNQKAAEICYSRDRAGKKNLPSLVHNVEGLQSPLSSVLSQFLKKKKVLAAECNLGGFCCCSFVFCSSCFKRQTVGWFLPGRPYPALSQGEDVFSLFSSLTDF